MASYEQTSAAYDRKNIAKLRECLKDEFGSGHARISGSSRWHDAVSVYGRMPNSGDLGWYELGNVRDAMDRYNIG